MDVKYLAEDLIEKMLKADFKIILEKQICLRYHKNKVGKKKILFFIEYTNIRKDGFYGCCSKI